MINQTQRKKEDTKQKRFPKPRENYYNQVMMQIKAVEKHYERLEKQRKKGVKREALDALENFKKIEEQYQEEQEGLEMLRDASSGLESVPLQFRI